MVAALYRRYRPESFSELIGQSHVTGPLRTALRADRVNHAYLFSGPRGCGKTTSARILARCLNCAEGPTHDPCGTCDSCVELGRDGGGSLDVVEIDAASHGGVDDARDLRERATFAPSRDRYKVFIIDEAHMVTSGGFNALLKIVEEPPEHVKFIFATTEPDKVIGTIRSRTHHYPFRLIAPAPMLEYVQGICEREGVTVEPGVLPLVVRAGGGSARDTMSLLDQLIAGSESSVTYEHAVALLGFTHGALLDEIVGALAASDAPSLFAAIDRVVQAGQDPRRFVEDLLERLRDLIVAHGAQDPAAILHGVPEDELATLVAQARRFGHAELSRAADIVARSLTDMAGATSPRLHLELMAARLLVPESGDPEVGTIARLERLEQRLDGGAAPSTAAASDASAPAQQQAPTPQPSPEPAPHVPAAPEEAAPEDAVPRQPASAPEPAPAAQRAAPAGPITFAQLKDAWPEVVQQLEGRDRGAWMVVQGLVPVELRDGDVLVLDFPSHADVERFRERTADRAPIAEQLRTAIRERLGIEVKYLPGNRGAQRPPAPRAGGEEGSHGGAPAAPPTGAPLTSAPVPDAPAATSARRPSPAQPAEASATVGGWAVAAIPTDADAPPADLPEPELPDEPEPDPFTFVSAPSTPAPHARVEEAPAASSAPERPRLADAAVAAEPERELTAAEAARYGEAVVREELGAELIEERPREGRR